MPRKKAIPGYGGSWEGTRKLEKLRELGGTCTIEQLCEYFGLGRVAMQHVTTRYHVDYVGKTKRKGERG